MPDFSQRLNMSGGGKRDSNLANESPHTLLNKLESQLGYLVDALAALDHMEQVPPSSFERALFSRSKLTPASFDEEILQSERLCRIVITRAVEASVDLRPFDGMSIEEVRLTDIEDVFEKIDAHTQTQIAESVFDERVKQGYGSERILGGASAYLNGEVTDQTLLHRIGYADQIEETRHRKGVQGWGADLLALPTILRNTKNSYRERVDQLRLRYDGGYPNDNQEIPAWEVLLIVITLVLAGRQYIDQQTAIAVILGILAQLRRPDSIISIPDLDQQPDADRTVSRSLLWANPRSWVGVFPKGTSEIELFRDFDCWGTIHSLFRSNPSFIAIYEGGKKGQIEYFADVTDVLMAGKYDRYGQIRNYPCVNQHDDLITITDQSKLAQPIVSNGSYIRSPRGRFVRLGVFRAASQVSDLLNP